MPYRRLPNTDKSRLKALKTALQKQEKRGVFSLPFELQQRLNKITRDFETKLNLKNTTASQMRERNKQHAKLVSKCRIYISHFLQVVNMAILRGELQKNTRTYYGLEEQCSKLPDLHTESMLIHWGALLINGEQKRMLNGGSRMNNPSLALVSINFENFKESFQGLEVKRSILERATKDLNNCRVIVDALILELWNILESHFDKKNKQELEQCIEWGINYVYRKSELKRLEQKQYEQSITLSLNLT